MKSLQLTTNQVKLGILVQTSTGYSFVPMWLVTIYLATFTAAIVARLTKDILTVYAGIIGGVMFEVRYHLGILAIGFRVVAGGLNAI